MPEREILTRLPDHGPGGAAAWPGRLRVDGLVERPLELTAAELAALMQQHLTDDFTCIEGWTVPALDWRGVPLLLLLELAGARPEATWVQASAGDFSVPLPREEAGAALLALRLGDEPLPPAHGGPVRLVLPGGVCFTSIKWLDRLELRHTPGVNTGQHIALARLRPTTE